MADATDLKSVGLKRPVPVRVRPSAAAKNVHTKDRQLSALNLREADLEESFTRSSGPGGQHVNKVATAVTLRHRPTGISVTVQDSRSQAMNRKLARARLRRAVEQHENKKRAADISRREKERRRKSPRPRALKKRILESKRKHGALKKQRSRVDKIDNS
jgi:protein subunit release factor B